MRLILSSLLVVALGAGSGCTLSNRHLPAGVPSAQSSHEKVIIRNTRASDLDVFYSVNGKVETFAGRVNGMSEGEVRVARPCGCSLFGVTASGERVSFDFVRGEEYSYLVPKS